MSSWWGFVCTVLVFQLTIDKGLQWYIAKPFFLLSVMRHIQTWHHEDILIGSNTCLLIHRYRIYVHSMSNYFETTITSRYFYVCEVKERLDIFLRAHQIFIYLYRFITAHTFSMSPSCNIPSQHISSFFVAPLKMGISLSGTPSTPGIPMIMRPPKTLLIYVFMNKHI